MRDEWIVGVKGNGAAAAAHIGHVARVEWGPARESAALLMIYDGELKTGLQVRTTEQARRVQAAMLAEGASWFGVDPLDSMAGGDGVVNLGLAARVHFTANGKLEIIGAGAAFLATVSDPEQALAIRHAVGL
jgi:hypothetical protein